MSDVVLQIRALRPTPILIEPLLGVDGQVRFMVEGMALDEKQLAPWLASQIDTGRVAVVPTTPASA